MSTQTTPDDAMDAALPAISPGAVLDAMENPAVFAETARGDLYVQMGTMRTLMANPNFPLALRVEYIKYLGKLGRVEQPDPGQQTLGAGLPTIQIVFPNSGQMTTIAPQPHTIDVTPDDE